MKGAFALIILLLAVPLRAAVLTGLDALEADGFSALRGKRVGLITNGAARDLAGRDAAEVLRSAPGVVLAALFSPEHGFAAALPAGASVSTSAAAGLTVHSLYGARLRPGADELAGLDVLVFDMQDVGARFYTYLTTMAYAMEAAAKAGLPFVVLDRPNPAGGEAVEGPVLSPSIRAFTAYLPVPVRHGLTPGEAAALFRAEAGIKLPLTVVALRGWRRSMTFDETGLAWIPPSPNIRDVDSAILYSGIGCFEATNLAMGRGSATPFRWVGAPWLDAEAAAAALTAARLPGLNFRVESRTPEAERYAGVACRGVAIDVVDRRAARPLDAFVHLACFLRDRHPKDFTPRWDEVARMVGTTEFERLYKAGAPPETILALFHREAARFDERRRAFLLYP